jgi:hypothetical protein
LTESLFSVSYRLIYKQDGVTGTRPICQRGFAMVASKLHLPEYLTQLRVPFFSLAL